jgi:RNA polymerase sigma-70 factor (ECF subfamily)
VSWLYGIARNVVFDQLRVRKRTEPRADVPDVPHDHLPQTLIRLDVADAIARLPDEQRQVIEMKFLIGLPNAEVAEILGKTIGAVNAQQWRALGNLRRILEEGSG